MYKRLLKLSLPQRQSAFLWGARKTGKSTYLHSHFPSAVYYDLLQSDLFLRLSKEPHLLRQEVLALSKEQLSQPIIIDEVQKIPKLLDEIHWLIENTDANFILCGSSARKLKRAGVNLLGGRAWRFEFYPLVYSEIPDFDLLRSLNHGMVPSHYLSAFPKRSLRAYVTDYLKKEILEEGLARNLPAFARFLDAVAFTHGELTNYTNIASDCGVDAKTVKEYYHILIDTLLGYYVYPYTNQTKRKTIIATPKFYLFDVGLVNYLTKRTLSELKGSEAGRAFEHFILMELMAYRGIKELDFPVSYWRTKTGLEVDFVLGKAEIAIEVKINDHIRRSDIKGLIAFAQELRPKKALVVSTVPRAQKLIIDGTEIMVLPWETFLHELWKGKIIK